MLTEQERILASNLNDNINTKIDKLNQMQVPILTTDKDYNCKNLGQYFVYSSDWITLTPAPFFATPTIIRANNIVTGDGANFFIRDIRGCLCSTTDPVAFNGGTVSANFNRDTQFNVYFNQDSQYLFNDFMPINLILGNNEYPHVLPQWRGVKPGAMISIIIRNYELADANTYRLKIMFTGFKRSRGY